jgi:hemerythrin-like metal-binding protein
MRIFVFRGVAVTSNLQSDLARELQKIDDQHGRILAIAGALLASARDKKPLANLYERLKDLVNILSVHFAVENALFAQFKYPNMTSHMMDHKKIFEEINSQFQSLKKGDKTISPLLADYIVYLEKTHLEGADREYREYFTRAGD